MFLFVITIYNWHRAHHDMTIIIGFDGWMGNRRFQSVILYLFMPRTKIDVYRISVNYNIKSFDHTESYFTPPWILVQVVKVIWKCLLGNITEGGNIFRDSNCDKLYTIFFGTFYLLFNYCSSIFEVLIELFIELWNDVWMWERADRGVTKYKQKINEEGNARDGK